MKLAEFYIPGLPPSVNRLYSRTKSGKVFKIKKARDFEKKVLKIFGSKPRYSGMLSLHLDFTFKDSAKLKRRDLDNMLKETIDSLQFAGLIKNDREILELHVRKIKGEKNGIFGGVFLLNDGVSGDSILVRIQDKPIFQRILATKKRK